MDLHVTSRVVSVSGRVESEGKIASFQLDGKEMPLNDDGSFTFHRAVPMGESTLKLEAIDEWGQNSQASIKVSRTVPIPVDAEYAPLDPTKIKAKTQSKSVALIIGVDKYENAPAAEYAENDAKVFYDYALTSLGIPSARVKLLTGSDARRLDVQKAIRNWLKPLVIKGQSDVIIYFSGHGLASDDGTDLFLLPFDGDREFLAESAIRRKDILDAIIDSGAASAVIFLDTCFSGGTRGKENLMASSRPIVLTAIGETIPDNITILAASANDQLSNALPQAQHGLFSYFLMKGLEGEAATGAERSITAAKLETYLSERVPVEAAKQGRTQSPQMIGNGERVISAW